MRWPTGAWVGTCTSKAALRARLLCEEGTSERKRRAGGAGRPPRQGFRLPTPPRASVYPSPGSRATVRQRRIVGAKPHGGQRRRRRAAWPRRRREHLVQQLQRPARVVACMWQASVVRGGMQGVLHGTHKAEPPLTTQLHQQGASLEDQPCQHQTLPRCQQCLAHRQCMLCSSICLSTSLSSLG